MFRLVPSTPSTGATAFGYSPAWPTPVQSDRPHEGNVRLIRAKWQAGELTEDEATAMLRGQHPAEAQGKIPAAWPTPKAKEDGRTPEAWERARQRHYETRKEKGTSSGGPAGANGSLAVTVRRIEEEPKGKLSGQWTLALMGFPPDWCDDLPPDPLGTTPT